MLSVLLTLVVVGILLWAVLKYIPLADPFPKIITAVVVIGCILYVLRAFGLLSRIGALG